MNQFQFELMLNTLTVIGGFYLYNKYFMSKMNIKHKNLLNVMYFFWGLLYILQVFVDKDSIEKQPVQYSNNKMMSTLFVLFSLAWFFKFFDSKRN